MFVKQEISVYDFVSAISETVDLVSPTLNGHQRKTACIACNIALQMNLPNDEIQDIVLASMLHDIGEFSIAERIKDLKSELNEDEKNRHSLLGYKLLKDFEPLAKAAVLVKHHHADYNIIRRDIPIGSYIIRLADMAAALFDEGRDILVQIPEIKKRISEKNHKFHPDVFAAFLRMAALEYVWMETFLSSFSAVMMKRVMFSKEIVDLETLLKFAQVIAQIVDFRSEFTVAHSRCVAAVAREIAAISGFSERERSMMEIAGLLHDLGKLAVTNNILEKKGKLNKEDFNAVKSHTYYTFVILSKVNGLEDLAVWAAYHHERRDGNGYPFHVKEGDFPKMARVMAVADILTALTEDRPYRPGMDREKAMEILFAEAANGGVDKDIVELANRNFPRINDIRLKAQKTAREKYDAFYNNTDEVVTKSASPNLCRASGAESA